jgi:hypothetical protein
VGFPKGGEHPFWSSAGSNHAREGASFIDAIDETDAVGTVLRLLAPRDGRFFDLGNNLVGGFIPFQVA